MSNEWRLHNSDSTCEVWKRNETERECEILHIDKQMKRACVKYEYFILKSEELYRPQQQETDKWIKYSAKYGHWTQDAGYIDVETAKFIIDRLNGIKENTDGSNN